MLPLIYRNRTFKKADQLFFIAKYHLVQTVTDCLGLKEALSFAAAQDMGGSALAPREIVGRSQPKGSADREH